MRLYPAWLAASVLLPPLAGGLLTMSWTGAAAAFFWATINGESWHNMHHADPICARHGALRGQIDSSARVIQVLERFGWAWDVR